MPSVAWSSEEDRILKALRPNVSTSNIAKILTELGYQRTSEGVRKRAGLLGLKFITAARPNTTQLTNSEKKVVVAILGEPEAPAPELPVAPSVKAKITTASRQSTQAMMEDLQEIRDLVGRKPEVVKRPDTDKLSLCVLLSDFHVGKVIPDEDGGQLYNMEIAKRRMDGLARSILDNCAVDPEDCDEVVILLAGDMVDGEGIYPGQELHIETHVAEQVKAVSTKLWKLALDLRTVFPQVRIITSRGNHGRSGNSDEANWDNIVYQQLEILADMGETDGIIVKNLYGNFNTFEVKGWKGLLRHQAPAQADTPAAIAKLGGWYDLHRYDFIAYGHWHHWGIPTWNGRPLFRNGSLGGGDDYAEQFGANDQPAQLAFTVSEDKLMTGFYVINFE